MNRIERHNKTKEIFSKFKNGEELYRTSSTFNMVVHMMVEDVDVHTIIQDLIKCTDAAVNALNHQLLTNPHPGLFIKSKPEN
jgi:hypothetical protein